MRLKIDMDTYDRVIGIGGGGLRVASLISLLFGKSLSLVEVTPAIDIRSLPSRFERSLIVDDVMQSRFTMFVVCDELRKEGFRVSESDVFVICKCVEGIDIDIDIPKHIKKPFDRLLKKSTNLIDYKIKDGKPEISEDFTSFNISEDLSNSIIEIIRANLESVELKGRDELCKEIKDQAISASFYKPSLLFREPDLVLRISKYIYKTYIENADIDGIISLTNMAVPIVVGIGLFARFSGEKNKNNFDFCFVNPNRYTISNTKMNNWKKAIIVDSVIKTGKTFETFMDYCPQELSIEKIISVFSSECYDKTLMSEIDALVHIK